MSWPDVNATGSEIYVTQDRGGAKLWLTLHADPLAVLAKWPTAHLAILTTAYRRPFSIKGLGNKMADAIEAAGLPEICVTHG